MVCVYRFYHPHSHSERVSSATTSTQTQLSSHARFVVDKISPAKDVSLVTTHFPRSLASAISKPILYYNYNVGECNDLIFGFSLVDYATARGLAEGDIPKIMRICIQEVDQRGLDAEGIYRVSFLIYFRCQMLIVVCKVSGRHAIVQDVSQSFFLQISGPDQMLRSYNTR
jgi:hypothetical protein